MDIINYINYKDYNLLMPKKRFPIHIGEVSLKELERLSKELKLRYKKIPTKQFIIEFAIYRSRKGRTNEKEFENFLFNYQGRVWR